MRAVRQVCEEASERYVTSNQRLLQLARFESWEDDEMVKKNIESGKHASAHLESVRNLDTWPFPQLLIMLIDVELLSSGTSTPFPNTAPALRD